MGVPTDRRATVRVLVRGSGAEGSAPAQRKIGGYLINILGEAKPEDWLDSPFEIGDLEGIIWTTPRQVEGVMKNLRATAGIVAVKGYGESGSP